MCDPSSEAGASPIHLQPPRELPVRAFMTDTGRAFGYFLCPMEKDSQEFWTANPVAAAAIDAERGTDDYFTAFDALREADNCEPWPLSNTIHGYETAHGKKVLDVGCGNGYVLKQYARTAAEVHGVDFAESAVELSRKRLKTLSIPWSAQQSPADSIPFEDEQFDIVCSMGVLHHIIDPAPAVDEIFRVMKPGGQLIAMLYYRYSWNNLVLLRLKRLLHPDYRGLTQQEAVNRTDGAECPYARVYSRSEAADLFSRFENITFTVNGIGYRQLLMPGAERYLPSLSGSWVARALGWSLYTSAQKPQR